MCIVSKIMGFVAELFYVFVHYIICLSLGQFPSHRLFFTVYYLL